MTEGTSTTAATATTEAAGPVAAVAAPTAAAPAPVEAQVAAMAAAAASTAAAPAARVEKPAAPAVGPAAVALAAIEAAAAAEAAAAKKAAAAEARKDSKDSDDSSMSDAETLEEVELASIGDSGAAAAGQEGLPCGVLPAVDAPVAAAPPVEVPVGDAGFALSPALLGLLGLGALGLGWLLLRDKDDDDDVDEDENSPPVAADETVAVNEDATVSGTLDATDEDGDTLTYTLGTAVTGLTLNSNGSYTFDASSYDSLDAGQTQTLTTTYTVSDGQGGSDTGNITITVTGVNDAPVAADDTAAANENGPSVTGNVATNDTDADGDTLSYSLQAPVAGLALNANGTYTFDPTDAAYQGLATGATMTVVATVIANDGHGGTDTSTLTITVTGQNDAPVITSGSAATVAENAPATTVVYDAAATDPEGDAVTFSLTGADAALFTIDPATGEVRLVNPANFEADASYSFTVVATDSAGATDTQDVTLAVTDVNESPAFTSAATASVDENVAPGTEVYDANATDPEGATLTYSLGGADAAFFTIDPATGEVFIIASPDFETRSSYSITVTASDGTNSTTQPVVISVNDLNEAPVLTVDDTTPAVDENSAVGTVVTDADATDVDGDTVTFSLTGADAAFFAIDPNTGVVTVAQNIDYETDPTLDFTIIATDSGGATDSEAVTVTVNDVDEPVIASLDVDNDANTLTSYTLDAGTATYIYQDDDDIANNVTLINFGATDVIQFEAAAGSIAYAAIDTGDGDGLNDLVITVNNGGTLSEIRIEDVADSSVFVFDEASAEAAVAGDNNFQPGVMFAAPSQTAEFA